MGILEWLDEIAHHIVDITILFRYLFEVLKQVFFAVWQPVEYVFVFLFNFLKELRKPLNFNQEIAFNDGLTTILNNLPYWQTFLALVISAIIIAIFFAIIKSIQKI